MPRAQRVHFDGAVYHVYNRLARGERVYEEDGMAAEFVQLLREVVERDGVTVFAWVLLPNHYHLAVRTGVVALGRTIKTLQWRTARSVNRSAGVYGPWRSWGKGKCGRHGGRAVGRPVPEPAEAGPACSRLGAKRPRGRDRAAGHGVVNGAPGCRRGLRSGCPPRRRRRRMLHPGWRN